MATPSRLPEARRPPRGATALARAGERLALTAATVGLPLPRRGDWQAEDGWLPAGLVACCGGALLATWLAWSRLAPRQAPHAWRFLGADVALALADLAVAAAYAWRPNGPAAAWRTLTIAGALGGGVLCDPAGLRARLAFPCLLAACLLALGMRAGETLGAALATPLHARAVRDPFADRPAVDWVPGAEVATGDDSPLRACWRVVAELWLLAAFAGALSGATTGLWRPAAGFCALGGAVLVLGTAVATLRASWEARGYRYEAAHIAAFWGMGLAVAAGVAALALAVPLPRAPVTPARVTSVLAVLARHRLPAHGAALTRLLGRAAVTPRPVAPIAQGFWPLLWAVLRGAFWSTLGLLFVYPLVGVPITLAVMAAVGFIWARSRRGPRWLARLPLALARLLRALLGFWGSLRWPRRMRAVLERLGWLRRAEEGDPAGGPALTAYERAWAWLDPRRAVRLTYRRLLRQATAAGVPRHARESPRAYERALTGAGLAGEDLAGLTEVYEEARFSDHAPDRGWPARARRGLAALRPPGRRRDRPLGPRGRPSRG